MPIPTDLKRQLLKEVFQVLCHVKRGETDEREKFFLINLKISSFTCIVFVPPLRTPCQTLHRFLEKDNAVSYKPVGNVDFNKRKFRFVKLYTINLF